MTGADRKHTSSLRWCTFRWGRGSPFSAFSPGKRCRARCSHRGLLWACRHVTLNLRAGLPGAAPSGVFVVGGPSIKAVWLERPNLCILAFFKASVPSSPNKDMSSKTRRHCVEGFGFGNLNNESIFTWEVSRSFWTSDTWPGGRQLAWACLRWARDRRPLDTRAPSTAAAFGLGCGLPWSREEHAMERN